ncbi:uncharacterized protein LOC124629567 [Helicoverpa zea]|uniref:uncharacterized protein LOC124629567 n=1 Tax=Helicoverpa zea TaxID=7113 RepID=UPI001F58ADFC|nr:uncharacterized protein LOC124629567 [Helicoverpa zea]
MNFLENITFRRPRTKSDSMLTDENELHTTNVVNETATSLPELSDDDDDEIKKLKEQVFNLTLELQSAHSEIESLSIENSKLKKLNENLTKKNDIFKKITSSPAKLNVSSKKINITNNDGCDKQTQTEPSSKVTSSKQAKKELPIPKPHKSAGTPNKVCDTQDDNTKKQKNPNKLQPTSTVKQSNQQDTSSDMKLCILSTNNKNKILTIAEKTFPNYKVCHYLSPGCGIMKLIDNIDLKLKNYTMDDYCLIFIGEADFRQTNNYIDLTIAIRQTLSKINHTNVIICAPTFRLNGYSTMYNGRIESFNSLLYLDACTHHYAYLFDSNYYLSYDYKMFWKKYGIVNNYGMSNIFMNLGLMIKEFDMCDVINVPDRENFESSHCDTNHNECQSFFL